MAFELTVLSAATRDSEWRALVNYSHENHKKFCECYGGTAIKRDIYVKDRPASWEKLTLLSEYAGQEVLWFDADCIFSPHAKPGDFKPESNKLRTLKDSNGINCSALLFPGEIWVADLLEYWYNAATDEEITHRWWEQKTFRRLVESGEIETGTPIPLSAVIHAGGGDAKNKLERLRG